MTYNSPGHNEFTWRKSSYSSGQGKCVEIGIAPGVRAIRDSKLGDASPIIEITVEEFAAFIADVKNGWLD